MIREERGEKKWREGGGEGSQVSPPSTTTNDGDGDHSPDIGQREQGTRPKLYFPIGAAEWGGDGGRDQGRFPEPSSLAKTRVATVQDQDRSTKPGKRTRTAVFLACRNVVLAILLFCLYVTLFWSKDMFKL